MSPSGDGTLVKVFPFRRKTLFHTEEALPDPEELKLRFRRRVLLLTLTGFLVVLAIPVARDLRPALQARAQTRALAQKILETRTLASSIRAPISLELADNSRSWKRTVQAPGPDCTTEAPGPAEVWDTPIQWKLQWRGSKGESSAGRTLCLHPTAGALLEGVPVADGKLLVTALRETDSNDWVEAAYLLLGDFGAEIQMVSR